MRSLTFSDFAALFYEQIVLAKESDSFDMDLEDFFTIVMLEYLEEAGEVDSPILCPFRSHGLQLNAYSMSEDCENVDIFVSLFSSSEIPQRISRTDVDAALKRAIQLYRKAVNNLYASFDKDSDTYGFAHLLYKHKNSIKNVRIIALTNGLIKPIDLKNIHIEGAEVSFSIWDMDRLYRCASSGKMRETIEIDFIEEFGIPIECIENTASKKYRVYLAILPGKILAGLYEKHGARLLERNVRSFLQVKGQVNKGIRDTIKDEPEMFLAYNNGISVTAEDVEIIRDENGKPSIAKIRDMQIVNGGQTTASIFNASVNKKLKADLDPVYVQMKLSVVSDSDQLDQIVPRISEYANTQNKIQVADFSANDPFHRKMEEISRVTWTPAQGGIKPRNWFYERARGQYVNMLARETTALRRKQYKEEHPLFTKTDLAKYENTWDQLPYIVSEGAQKNFKKFTQRIKDRGGFIPDAKYYADLIGKAILFRRTEKLVQLQNYGGYRANIVTYTLAFLSKKTSQRIDLGRIWKEQQLTEHLETEIVKISALIHEYITNPPGGANISEWCKNVRCWNTLAEKEYILSDALQRELILVEKPNQQKNISTGINAITDEEAKIVKAAMSIPAETWFSLSRWAKETNNFQAWQRSLVFTVGTQIGRSKQMSYKQANQALKVYTEAERKGFC
ncbi:AIPR family protein [Propionispora hippei]|uniref:AIPR protein n=1 Tax=Propionispora hippei DSM 15287 TaxID=1123003 RepID=A0A1M6DY77_9FIRM|nr:AIPR family protein [Propionispora hippei]SHI78161.1 AIPR protein [Propionispora hippei DSM 15287]